MFISGVILVIVFIYVIELNQKISKLKYDVEHRERLIQKITGKSYNQVDNEVAKMLKAELDRELGE